MAVRKFSPFPVLKGNKFPVYEALYKINMAFQSIAFEIERLDDYEAISLDTLRLYRMTAEDLRSAMNHRIAEVLETREMKDWNHFSKQLRKVQAKLKAQSK